MIFSSIISRLIDVSFFLMLRGSNSDFLSRGTAAFASSPFSRTSPTVSLNTDFRSRTSSASVSAGNSSSFSLRSYFAARTSGLSLYLGIILTSDLIFLFIPSRRFTQYLKKSLQKLDTTPYLTTACFFFASCVIIFIRSYFLSVFCFCGEIIIPYSEVNFSFYWVTSF